jgi:hypothetical protein
MKWDTIIKTTDTPIIVRINGVDLPSQANIIVKLGTETYTKLLNASSFKLDTNDITKLELLLGGTSLAVGGYTLHISVVNADHPKGVTLTDCVTNVINIKVRDIC